MPIRDYYLTLAALPLLPLRFRATRIHLLAAAGSLFTCLLAAGPALGQTVAAGGTYSATLRADGSLWSWGDLRYDPGWESPPAPTSGPSRSFASFPLQIGTATTWRQVAYGAAHCLAIQADGKTMGLGGEPRRPAR